MLNNDRLGSVTFDIVFTAFFAAVVAFGISLCVFMGIGAFTGLQKLDLFSPSEPLPWWEVLAVGGSGGISTVVFWAVFRLGKKLQRTNRSGSDRP